MISSSDEHFLEIPRRTGRPNIGHATGRGALPDGRTGRPKKMAELSEYIQRIFFMKSDML
ncbi:hypothetical protein KS419_07015 [Bacillus tamaricis]|uniref:Uncharacterized protein n=1 Tax=Evansella tamaricis TaxID=2069301 RepID=A0ABS6JDK6_9BACI|nr:hypothetical protein [Evansella tamaricis]MBU9711480.1 hypothetical protein [Evansella tamaricis]